MKLLVSEIQVLNQVLNFNSKITKGMFNKICYCLFYFSCLPLSVHFLLLFQAHDTLLNFKI